MYPSGGWTAYCGIKFENRSKTVDDRPLSVEHVVPAKWMVDKLGCTNRTQCRDTNTSFNHFDEGDLHNMYPALRNVNSSRADKPFGILEGENWRYVYCDYERSSELAEPRELMLCLNTALTYLLIN